jgi:hypothetical protein
VPALAQMLARSFFDDPLAAWAWRPDRLRAKAFERFQLVRLRQLLADDEVWISDDLMSAALWAPPRRWRVSVPETMRFTRAFAHPQLLCSSSATATASAPMSSHPRSATSTSMRARAFA